MLINTAWHSDQGTIKTIRPRYVHFNLYYLGICNVSGSESYGNGDRLKVEWLDLMAGGGQALRPNLPAPLEHRVWITETTSEKRQQCVHKILVCESKSAPWQLVGHVLRNQVISTKGWRPSKICFVNVISRLFLCAHNFVPLPLPPKADFMPISATDVFSILQILVGGKARICMCWGYRPHLHNRHMLLERMWHVGRGGPWRVLQEEDFSGNTWNLWSVRKETTADVPGIADAKTQRAWVRGRSTR